MRIFQPTISGSLIESGSMTISGSVTATQGFTGSLFGTASWAQNSLTASYFVTSSVTSASYAATASFVTGSIHTAGNLALSASYTISSSYATTASWALNFITASVTSASYAATASNINGGLANYIPLWTGSTGLSSSIIYQSASNLGIYTTVPSGALDISYGGNVNQPTIILGADNTLTTRTQNTQKFATIAIAPYNNASSSTAIIQANTANNSSSVYIGGGSTNLNTVTDIVFYTAVNVGTLIGTERFRLNGSPINTIYNSAQFSGSFNKTGSATINANLLVSGSVIVSGSIYPVPSGSGQGLNVGTASAANHTLGGPKNAWYRLYVAKNSIVFVDDVTEDLNYSLGVDTAGSLSYNGFPIINGSGSISASYPIKSIGTSLYTTKPGSGISGSSTASIFFGNNTGNYALTADYSNFIGDQAGVAAYSSSYSNFLGANAGFSASISYYSNFLGYLAGYQAQYANSSNFLGYQAGTTASFASNSNFLGNSAGISATNANNSNFFGQQAGRQASSASYSNLFGYKVGNNVAGGAAGIKSNNIIIGTNITLPDGTSDSINLGSIIFATGSYSTTTGNAFSGTVNGKVGINVFSFDATNPESLLVSGSNINTIVGTTNINNYAQLNIKNLNSGNAASADVVATNDSGTESGNFVDLGINSSTFAGTIGTANEAYLYHTGSNFLIGNTTRGAASLKLFSGNDATVFPVLITGSNAIITGSLLGTASYTATASSADTFNVRTSLTASSALINGTITAQTLVVSVVSSSIDYSSGSNIFGSSLTNTHQFTGSVSITGSFSVVGSISGSSFTGSHLGTSSYAIAASSSTISDLSSIGGGPYYPTFVAGITGNQSIWTDQAGITYNADTNVLTTTSSYSTTASYAVSASIVSNAVTAQSASNFNISSTLVLDQTLTDFATVALTAFPATNNVFTQATGSYRSAFFKYTAYTGSSAARSGEVIASWNGGVITYTDFSTVDVGDTTGVVTSVVLAGTDVQFNVTTPAAKWTIKSLATFI